MDTVLYQGFGGCYVRKDDKVYYWADSNLKWEDFKKASDIEKDAARDPGHKWEIILDNPLRDTTWERQAREHWVLTETNQGFA
jgi:hypothetical protein